MRLMKRYVVMHDYGPEGWKVIGEFETLLEAVYAREDDLRNGGGESAIFIWKHPLDAYEDAAGELRRMERQRNSV